MNPEAAHALKRSSGYVALFVRKLLREETSLVTENAVEIKFRMQSSTYGLLVNETRRCDPQMIEAFEEQIVNDSLYFLYLFLALWGGRYSPFPLSTSRARPPPARGRLPRTAASSRFALVAPLL